MQPIPIVYAAEDADPPSAHQPISLASPIRPPAGVADSLLLLHSDTLNDIEAARIALENRVRSLIDAKGVSRDIPEVAGLADQLDEMKAMEAGATLRLKRTVRAHPLGGWIKGTIGIGEKQGARLIAAIGDPLWNDAADRPRRGPAELWAYCGYHVLRPDSHIRHEAQRGVAVGVDQINGGTGHSPFAPQGSPAGAAVSGFDASNQSAVATQIPHAAGVAPSRQRGQKMNWNPDAKMRAYLVAEACMKARTSPFRTVYEDGRLKYQNAVHNADCRRCGPSGKPALAGSPLSLGHQHARALRLVAKAVLKDLFLYAREHATPA